MRQSKETLEIKYNLREFLKMICTTIKKKTEGYDGHDCNFMTKKGCSYIGGSCLPVVDQCNGCKKTIELEAGVFCLASPDPPAKWRQGKCNMATHVAAAPAKKAIKINPLKASKRGG